MGIIRELPPSVINQIAAGEVVERPASVVKELLENAIDAGAGRVELAVERGGKDLVRVADDGKGMGRDDLPLAFRPHATSKLAEADDLFRIRTLGFRGEALAAIAEVSRVRCQTRTPGADVGTELAVEGGVMGEPRDSGGAPGTVIEVRNLFFNTPVRRTFLKSDSTEASHVAEAFTRVALAHPTIHMTLRSGGKVLHDLPPTTGIKERIAAFFGRELAESLLWVESRIEPIHLWGYVAHPSQSRSSAKGQFLFVGGRYVRDRALGHALAEAYRGLLMVGRQPVAFLFLDLPPEEVDVNVHPTKVEVRFRDGHRIYSQLLATVRQTFLGSDLHARLQAPPPDPGPARAEPDEPLRLAPAPAGRQEVASWFAPSGPQPPGFQPAPTPGYAGGAPQPDWARRLPPAPTAPAPGFDEFGPSPEAGAEPGAPPAGTPTAPGPDPSPPQTPTRREPALPPRALQVHDTYLIAETDEGMVVIDQHALHERILYEELKGRVERGGVEAQRLLVPEPVELSAVEADEVIRRRDVLAKLGLEVEPFGGGTVLVASVPAMLRGVPADRLLRDLAEHFRAHPLAPTADAVLEDVLNMVACKAAVKANQRLTPEEIAALLERRHLAANTHHCPHGRPTALVFTRAELERQFGRI
jgi:DNA mismatch repair protein MutL